MTERERLIGMLNDYMGNVFLKNDGLADYLLANGVIVLPCKVGQNAYYLRGNDICTAEVIKIELNIFTNPQMWLTIGYYSTVIGRHEYKSRIDLMLGKTVFLTREEAERALKGVHKDE